MNTTKHTEKAERLAAIRWPAMVIGLLLLNVGVCAFTVIAAARHPAAVVPDYYQRSIDWDSHRPAHRPTNRPANRPANDPAAPTAHSPDDDA